MTPSGDFSDADWFKSSFSDSNGTCVEVAFADGRVGVRDSKQHGAGPVLVFTAAEWASFLDTVRSPERTEPTTGSPESA